MLVKIILVMSLAAMLAGAPNQVRRRTVKQETTTTECCPKSLRFNNYFNVMGSINVHYQTAIREQHVSYVTDKSITASSATTSEATTLQKDEETTMTSSTGFEYRDEETTMTSSTGLEPSKGITAPVVSSKIRLEQLTGILGNWTLSPYWDQESKALYFSSAEPHQIHKYMPLLWEDPHTHTKGELEFWPWFVVPVSGNPPTVFIVNPEAEVHWDGTELMTVNSRLENAAYAKCDLEGRMFVSHFDPGSKPQDPSHSPMDKFDGYTKDGLLADLVEGVQLDCQFSFCWDSTGKFLYTYNGSSIMKHAYDSTQGSVSSSIQPTAVYSFDKDYESFGMTIDVDDNIWVSLVDDRTINQIDPKTGLLLQSIPLTVPPLGITWGGANLEHLYVTTNCGDDDAPGCGALWRITGLDTTGHPQGDRPFRNNTKTQSTIWDVDYMYDDGHK